MQCLSLSLVWRRKSWSPFRQTSQRRVVDLSRCVQKGISGNTSDERTFEPLCHLFYHEYTKLEVCTILFQVGNQYAAENEDELKDKIDFEEKPGYRLRTGICQVNHELFSTVHPGATIFCHPYKSLHLQHTEVSHPFHLEMWLRSTAQLTRCLQE